MHISAILTIGFSLNAFEGFLPEDRISFHCWLVAVPCWLPLPPHIDAVGARASAGCVSSLLDVVRMACVDVCVCMSVLPECIPSSHYLPCWLFIVWVSGPICWHYRCPGFCRGCFQPVGCCEDGTHRSLCMHECWNVWWVVVHHRYSPPFQAQANIVKPLTFLCVTSFHTRWLWLVFKHKFFREWKPRWFVMLGLHPIWNKSVSCNIHHGLFSNVFVSFFAWR